METYTKPISTWDRIMMAITFAEAGEAETARDILDKRSENQQRPETRVRKESEKRAELRM
ncbi:MAG: hypothetical protein A2511_09650 [Deltaproteobacteria bacterium RIFOXYD12_FULL_50_9]|nr:MAG: hypothetical protein A2511_09650 [Deltaproteobacteria bacterium RIFOXYD12_FULL_50_9]